MDGLTTIPPSNVLYDQEKLSLYRPGGYHPVCLGDTFKEKRYTIVHKLGWGGFSTVWLARDNLVKEWVALKLGTANSAFPSLELSTLQAIHQCYASNYAARLIDSFVHQGPNGSHLCLVTELLGPSVDSVVADYHTGGDRLEPETILKMSKQLLQAISSIHRAGYAHGDISGANVAFTASQLKAVSNDALFDIIGHPETARLARVDGKPLAASMPRQLVRKAGWANWIDEDEEDIRLIDWGEAFANGAEPAHLAQPGELKAPEIIFTGRFDRRIDLWRTGCLIYSFVFAATPFQYLGDEDVLVAQMVNFVEELPQEWQKTWELIRKRVGRSTSTGSPRHTGHKSHQPSKLESKFRKMVDEPKLMPLLPVIRGLMRFLPSDRLSAEEALRLLCCY